MQYRSLTFEEIETLESNSCWAEDWNRVKVAEDGFQAKFFHRVMFYGDIQLGCVQKEVEITKGFVKHSGINDATLRNVTVGNNCLIEKVGNYINNYTDSLRCPILAIGGMPDHIHILLNLGKDLSISEFVRNIKANTSRWLKTIDPHYRLFSWQNLR